MYVHAWSLPREIDAERWRSLHRDAVAVLVASSRVTEARHGGPTALAVLRGPSGVGPLVIEPDRVAFNGNAFRGESADALVLERRATAGLVRRADLRERVFQRCNTERQPYDLAVCAVLLAVARVLGDDLRLGTEGTLRSPGWREGAGLVRQTLLTGDRLIQDERGFLRWIATSDRWSGGMTLRSS